MKEGCEPTITLRKRALPLLTKENVEYALFWRNGKNALNERFAFYGV